MSVKLHYFNINGIAGFIRYMLHYGKVEFEDVRYESKSWPIESVKESLPYGQLPLYEEGDFKIAQSLAIGRYIAQKVGLLSTDVKEQAELDAIACAINDLRTHGSKIIYEKDPKRKEEFESKFINEHLPFYFSRFEKILKNKNGYFNGKLSWIDFLLVGVIESLDLFYQTELEKDYPTIKALVAKIQALPGVKEYIAKRKPYEFKM